jgi:hypothetical protein
MPRGVSGSEPETTFISAARQLEPGLGSNCKVQILISWSIAAPIAAILWSDQTINYGVGQRCELAVESSGGRRMILRTVGGARGDRALSLRGCRPGTASIRPGKASFSMGGLPSRKKRVPDAILRYRWKNLRFFHIDRRSLTPVLKTSPTHAMLAGSPIGLVVQAERLISYPVVTKWLGRVKNKFILAIATKLWAKYKTIKENNKW